MATPESENVMGRLQFMNQDGEWESFPTEDEIHRSKEVIAILEEFNNYFVANLYYICDILLSSKESTMAL